MAFEDDPAHPGRVSAEPHGGRARLGVNSLAHPELPDDFWTGSYEHALEFAEKLFERDYWAPLKLGSVISQDVANKIYDIAVNQGVGTAAKMIQEVAGVRVDGQIGPVTLLALNQTDPEIAFKKLCDAAAARHRHLAEMNPGVYGQWLRAWLERDAK
jgi:lysozyme family protein